MPEKKNPADANDLNPADAHQLIKAIEQVEKEEAEAQIRTQQNELTQSDSETDTSA